jgi:predicted amidohydrolase
MFQTPYELARLRESAESANGPTLERIRSAARKLSVHVVAGSFCEELDGRRFNSSYFLGPVGEILGVHRKVHLFDVCLDTVKVQESDVFSSGDAPLVVETPFARVGVAICYDTRFPAIFKTFETRGVEVAAIPAAFSRTTGAAHWHLLMRSRAVDYQIFLAAACRRPSSRLRTSRTGTRSWWTPGLRPRRSGRGRRNDHRGSVRNAARDRPPRASPPPAPPGGPLPQLAR